VLQDQGVIVLSQQEGASVIMMSPSSVTVTAHVEYYAVKGTTPIP